MKTCRFSIRLKTILALLTLAFLTAALPAKAQETILLSFNGAGDGGAPYFPVVMDATGNLYGTTAMRGANGAGTAFQLRSDGHGGWTESVLFSFGIMSVNGAFPSSGLLLDASGNLYGTTYQGGDFNFGTVYELSPDGNGGFTHTVLYSFQNDEQDGAIPFGDLTMDSAGNLYGTTSSGGANWSILGTVYELEHQSTGWRETVLHSFTSDQIDGVHPNTGLILDAAGNLYGVTESGGTTGAGTVYQMTPQSGGKWIERIIHNFSATGTAGINPVGKLTFDAAGNLFGGTSWGGIYGEGTVFEMKRKGGMWIERDLYSFNHNGVDGIHPNDGLIFDAAGSLYGTTSEGGTGGKGTVFKLSPHLNGIWTDKVLHNFRFNGSDGTSPNGGLIFDAAGNLYGTTFLGGADHGGTVFEFTP
jgi:uncharacterized repeat protein (TIGR03803 family)